MKTKEQIIEKVKEYGRLGFDKEALQGVLTPLNDFSRDDLSDEEKEENLFSGFNKIVTGAKLGCLLGYLNTVRWFNWYAREGTQIPDNIKWQVKANSVFKKGLNILGCDITFGGKGVSVNDVIFVADNKFGGDEDLAVITSVDRYRVEAEIIGVFDKKELAGKTLSLSRKSIEARVCFI